MERAPENKWTDRVTSVAFWLFLMFTLAWAATAVGTLGHAVDWWIAPRWVIQLIPAHSADEAVRLGETGDFLTGWLQPLALTWFVITVFMQMRELRLQRLEFEKLQEEYKGNKIATQEQAKHLEQANRLNNRTLVRSIIQDSKNLVDRNAFLTIQALNQLQANLDAGQNQFGQLDSISSTRWLDFARAFRADGEAQGLRLEVIWSDATEPAAHGYRARELIERMADQYSDLKQEAVRAEMEEYYDAFCHGTIQGELTKVCWDLCQKMRMRGADIQQ